MTEQTDFILYTTTSGDVRLQVMLLEESIWLTQKMMAELLDTTKQTISYHLTNIFKERELEENLVVKEILTTASDGKSYSTKFYNLDAIISVGYR